jgi:hypothetical protein
MGGRGSGWFGDPEGHARAGEEGGRKKSSKSKNGRMICLAGLRQSNVNTNG